MNKSFKERTKAALCNFKTELVDCNPPPPPPKKSKEKGQRDIRHVG